MGSPVVELATLPRMISGLSKGGAGALRSCGDPAYGRKNHPAGAVAEHAASRPSDARLRSWVNGQPRQDSTTADMIFGVAAIIADLSQYLVLDPGDLVLHRYPAGGGPIRSVRLPSRG